MGPARALVTVRGDTVYINGPDEAARFLELVAGRLTCAEVAGATQDRIQCVQPAMMAEVLGQPVSQAQRVRRNVVAHARHGPGLRVGELAAKQLRAFQRGRCGAKCHEYDLLEGGPPVEGAGGEAGWPVSAAPDVEQEALPEKEALEKDAGAKKEVAVQTSSTHGVSRGTQASEVLAVIRDKESVAPDSLGAGLDGAAKGHECDGLDGRECVRLQQGSDLYDVLPVAAAAAALEAAPAPPRLREAEGPAEPLKRQPEQESVGRDSLVDEIAEKPVFTERVSRWLDSKRAFYAWARAVGTDGRSLLWASPPVGGPKKEKGKHKLCGHRKGANGPGRR